MPYRLADIVVQCYQQSKYFPCPSRATINDIGAFAEDALPEVVIVGVMSLDTYSLCLGCRKKVEPTTEKIGKCSTVQSIDHCKKPLPNTECVIMSA